MRRPLLALALLALLALAAPAAAQPGARMDVLATALPDGGVLVAWSRPAGHQQACVYRYAPLPQEVLACAPGTDYAVIIPPGGDANLRINPGDTVEVRSYGARNELIQATGAKVRWRVWLPVTGR